MKNGILMSGTGIILLSILLSSCDKKDVIEDLSPEVQNYLRHRTQMTAMNAANGQMNNFMSVIAESQIRDGGGTIDGMNVDSSYYENYCDTCVWNWESCAVVTETVNGDGTTTTVYDFGEGCYEYGWLTSGKITYIWSTEGNKYYSKVIYDQYYSYGMLMNGFSEYSFESDGNSWVYANGQSTSPGSSGDTTELIEPVIYFNWSGTSSGQDEYTMIFDSGENYSYSSEYSNKWDSLSYTVLVGNYHYVSETDGYEYLYEVTEPLVTSYSCSDTWVPVSGIESTQYTEAGVTTNFSVNYGNGTCDNLAKVTENGKTTTVDFSDYYQICYDQPVSDAVYSSGKKK